MNAESISYETHASWVSDFILCSLKPYVKYSDLHGCCPPSEFRDAFQNALKHDSLGWFECVGEGDEMTVRLRSISERDAQVQVEVEWWRTSTAKFLDTIQRPVEVSRLRITPRGIRLQDIVNSDSARRFCLHGPADRRMLSRRLSDETIEQCKAEWLEQLHAFLCKQPGEVPMAVVGAQVPRPKALAISGVKLIEVLRTDSQERFLLRHANATDAFVRIKASAAQRETLQEQWREDAYRCLHEQKRSVTLIELGGLARRPAQLGPIVKLQAVLREDPQGRFHFSGCGNDLAVAVAPYVGQGNGNGAAVARAGAEGWAVVPGRSTAPRGRKASPVATVGRSTFRSQLRFSQWPPVPAPAPAPGNGMPHASGNSSTGSKSPDAAMMVADSLESAQDLQTSVWDWKSPLDLAVDWDSRPSTADSARSGRVGGNSALTSLASVGDSPDSAIRSHGSSWDWKGPLDDALVQDWAMLPEAVGASSVSPPPGLYAAERQVQVPSLAAALDVAGYKAHGSPAQVPLTAEAPDCAPRSIIGAITAATAAAVPAPPAVNTAACQEARLEDWLSAVLTGFPAELVAGFAASLLDEGFLCVQDLVVARTLGQLTPEYLSAFGFKLGHTNRLLRSLPTEALSA